MQLGTRGSYHPQEPRAWPALVSRHPASWSPQGLLQSLPSQSREGGLCKNSDFLTLSRRFVIPAERRRPRCVWVCESPARQPWFGKHCLSARLSHRCSQPLGVIWGTGGQNWKPVKLEGYCRPSHYSVSVAIGYRLLTGLPV